MSDASRRMPLVAMGFAVVALGCALVAAVVVIGRGDDAPPALREAPRPAVAPVIDRDVRADDVLALQRDAAEVVIEGGQTRGLRVRDAELAKALGLEDGDVLTALSGRPLVREHDLADAVRDASFSRGTTTLYIEALRAEHPTLLRWKLDGELRRARHASLGGSYRAGGLGGRGLGGGGIGVLGGGGSYGAGGGLGTSSRTADPAWDALLDTIEKVDDTHVRMPRKTADELLANTAALARGARIVPAVKNGRPDGLKLYAIRPSSVFARLALANGDTVQAINGHRVEMQDDLADLDKRLSKATTVTIELVRRGHPLIIRIDVTN